MIWVQLLNLSEAGPLLLLSSLICTEFGEADRSVWSLGFSSQPTCHREPLKQRQIRKQNPKYREQAGGCQREGGEHG